MGLNFKKITDVPVVDSVGEGDTLLLNVGGVAKQIPANKFSTSGSGGDGGGVGGGLIYGYDIASGAESFLAYADEALTQPLTYEEGKRLLLGGAGLYSEFMYDENTTMLVRNNIFMVAVMEAAKMAQCAYTNTEDDGNQKVLTIIFSDTVVG